MRKSLVVLSFSIFLPFQNVSAGELNTYYNEELQYTLSFEDTWVRFSQDMLNTLAPKERENSTAIFINSEDSSQLFVRHLNADNERYQLFNELITYVKETPIERQKLEKKLNPISTELGRMIENYSIEAEEGKVTLHLKQSSHTYGEIKTTLFWIMSGNKMIELEFYNFQNDVLSNEEAISIINSFAYSNNASTTIQEGSVDILENRFISENLSPLQKLINFLDNPVIWYGSGLTVLLVLACYIFYRFI